MFELAFAFPFAFPVVFVVVPDEAAAGFGDVGAAVGEAEDPMNSFTALPRSVPTLEVHVSPPLAEGCRVWGGAVVDGGVGLEMDGIEGVDEDSFVVGLFTAVVALSETTSAGGCLAASSCLRGEVVGVGVVPVNVATPVPLSSGVNEGEGGPALSPKISLMIDTMSSSPRSAAVGLREPLARGFPRAHSRAVARRSAVSSPR